jgi:predicted nucleotidyltransferase
MEKILDELVGKLKDAAKDNLKAVVLYGSAATGEFEERHSDINILCILQRIGAAELGQLHGVAAWWMRKGHPAPLVFTLERLRESADVFAIEMLDMKARHRTLSGDDFLTNLEVPLARHKLQVERELRTNLLRLRQSIMTEAQNWESQERLMASSISTFITLFRHALIAFGEKPPEGKHAIVERMAAVAGGNAAAFRSVLDFRAGKKKHSEAEVREVLQGYLELVERATDEVDRRVAASAGQGG